MARYGAVYIPTSVIGEVRSGDVPPSYVPPDYEWVDVSDSTLSDQALIGATWSGTEVVSQTLQPAFDPEFDMGPSMAELLGTAPKL